MCVLLVSARAQETAIRNFAVEHREPDVLAGLIELLLWHVMTMRVIFGISKTRQHHGVFLESVVWRRSGNQCVLARRMRARDDDIAVALRLLHLDGAADCNEVVGLRIANFTQFYWMLAKLKRTLRNCQILLSILRFNICQTFSET